MGGRVLEVRGALRRCGRDQRNPGGHDVGTTLSEDLAVAREVRNGVVGTGRGVSLVLRTGHQKHRVGRGGTHTVLAVVAGSHHDGHSASPQPVEATGQRVHPRWQGALGAQSEHRDVQRRVGGPLVGDRLQAREDARQVGAAILCSHLDIEHLSAGSHPAELVVIASHQAGHEGAVTQSVTGGVTGHVHMLRHIDGHTVIDTGVDHSNCDTGSALPARGLDGLAEGVGGIAGSGRRRGRVELHRDVRHDERPLGGRDVLGEIGEQSLRDLESLHHRATGSCDGGSDLTHLTGGAEEHTVAGGRGSGSGHRTEGNRRRAGEAQCDESTGDGLVDVGLIHGATSF